MEIPTTGGDSDLELVQAVKDGKISEEIINQRVDEILDVILPVTAAVAPLEGKPFDVDAHHAMAAKAAGESIVLLKNEGNILPLKKGTKVAVIGEFTQKARYQGADSSVINAPNPYDSKLLSDYYTGNIKTIPDVEFENLLGHPIPDGTWSGTLTMNDALCQMYYAKSGLARFVPRLRGRRSLDLARRPGGTARCDTYSGHHRQ